MGKHTNNLTNTDRTKIDQLGKQWSNLDGNLHKSTLAYIHTLLYSPNSQTIKSKNNLQKVINGLSKNNFNKNAGPILAMYKEYSQKINSNKLASTQTVAEKNALALRLAKEKNSLQTILKNKNAALQAALEGRTADAAAFEAKAKANLEQMEAAHKAVVSNLEQKRQTELLELEAKRKSIELEAQRHKQAANDAKKLVNQAAINLANAKARGNTEAEKAAQLKANIAARNLAAAARNTELSNARAALVQAKANAESVSTANKAAAAQTLKNKQAEFNRQLAANKAAANTALKNALAAAAANRNSVVAQAAANKAAADQAAAEAAQKVSQLEAAVTAGQENKRAALEAAEKAAKEAQAKANQEAANLKRNLAAKSVEANRLAGSLAEASRAGANAEKRFRTQLLLSKETEAKATRAKLATMAAQLEVVKSRGNAAAARKLANAHKAEANAAKQAAISAAEATENAKKVAANRQAAIIALEANVEAGKINKQALINAHTKAAEASAAAVAAAQAEKQAAAEALVALRDSSNATQAQLNNARAAINAANANKRATANKHAANMAKLKANANKGKAAAIEGLRAARAANKAAANKALANLKVASAQNVTNLQNALKRLNARRQAELEAKGTEKEAEVAAARIAAESIAAARLRALQNNLNKAKQEAANIVQQKDSNLNAQRKAAEAQAAQLEAELAKAKTLVGAATLTGMALGRAGGSVVGGLTRLAGLGRQVAGPNTGRKNVPPTGLGTVTPLPLRLENNPLIKRVQNTLALIGNKGNRNTRSYVTRNSNALVKSPNNNKLQKEFVRAISQWALSSTVKPNKPELREWVKSKNVSITNFNTFVKNYLGKMTNNPLYKTTNQNNPLFNKNAVNNSKALVVRTPNAVPASAGPNFTNITVRWLNNWKRYSNDELIKGVPGASVNGKVNPVTASGQTRLKLLNIVRNANKNKIVFGKPGAISYFIKKYKNGGEKDPYLRWLIETMIGPQIMAYKNSNNYTRALQWVRKVHGINAGTLNVNKYNQYINNSYLPNKLKQALLKHKQEILNKRGSSGTVLGVPSKPNVPSISTSGSTIGVPAYNKAQWNVIKRRPYMKSNKIERRGNLLKNKKTKAGYIYNENTRKILPVKTMAGSLYIANNGKSWPKNTSGFKL